MRLKIALLIAFLLPAALALGQTSAAKPATPAAPAAVPAGTPPTLPTEATVEAFLRRTFSYEKGLEWKVLAMRPSEIPGVSFVMVGFKNEQGQQQVMRFFIMPGQKWALVGDVVPFGADPFAPARQELEARAQGPARGPEKADFVLVEFSDLECPVCKVAHPAIERLMQDFPNARFVFQNFPLTEMHPWAFQAAAYAECVAQQNNDAFWKFISATYASQEQLTPANADQKLAALAQQAGASGEQAARCAAQPATAARVKESLALGEALNVTGTPTLFVNGRKVQNLANLPYELLKSLVETTTK
jgi:protein-disulfide isomerase